MNTVDSFLTAYRQRFFSSDAKNLTARKREALEYALATIPEARPAWEAGILAFAEHRAPQTPNELTGHEIISGISQIVLQYRRERKNNHISRGRIGSRPQSVPLFNEVFSPKSKMITSDILAECLKELEPGESAHFVALDLDKARSIQTHMTRVAQKLKWDYGQGTPYTGTINENAKVYYDGKSVVIYSILRTA